MGFVVIFDMQPSQISDHEADCCVSAITWINMIDRIDGLLFNRKMPSRRFHDLFEWGPLTWPIHWCELVSSTTIDCGGFASLYEHLFSIRGYDCGRLQLIEHADPAQVIRWRSLWESLPNASTSWLISDKQVYHEALVIRQNNTFLFFDPTDHAELGSRFSLGGTVIAMRFCSDRFESLPKWNGRILEPWAWIDVT